MLDAFAPFGKRAEAERLAAELVAADRVAAAGDGPRLADQLTRYGSHVLNARAFEAAEPVLYEDVTVLEKNAPASWVLLTTPGRSGSLPRRFPPLSTFCHALG